MFLREYIPKPDVQTSQNFLRLLHVAVSRFFFGGVAISVMYFRFVYDVIFAQAKATNAFSK